MESKQPASIGDALKHLTDELVQAYKSLAGARMDLWAAEKQIAQERAAKQDKIYQLVRLEHEHSTLKKQLEKAQSSGIDTAVLWQPVKDLPASPEGVYALLYEWPSEDPSQLDPNRLIELGAWHEHNGHFIPAGDTVTGDFDLPDNARLIGFIPLSFEVSQ